MGKRYDKDIKIEAVQLASEPGTHKPRLNVILALAKGLSADGNDN